MGAPDKVVQRILRHSRPHVTKERYIKVFDHTVLAAVEKMQTRIDELTHAKKGRQQLELKFSDGFGPPVPTGAECSTGSDLASRDHAPVRLTPDFFGSVPVRQLCTKSTLVASNS